MSTLKAQRHTTSAFAPVLAKPAPLNPISSTSICPIPDRAVFNRQNARHSTGPQSTEGKERVRLNALRHGINSKKLVLRSEDQAEFDQLGADLTAQHRPATLETILLVRKIQEAQWCPGRIFPQENALLQVLEDQHHDESKSASMPSRA